MVDKTTSIEDLIREVPESVRYMMNNGIKCLACGEPVWGTIESTCIEKGFSSARIDDIVRDLNALHLKTEKGTIS